MDWEGIMRQTLTVTVMGMMSRVRRPMSSRVSTKRELIVSLRVRRMVHMWWVMRWDAHWQMNRLTRVIVQSGTDGLSAGWSVIRGDSETGRGVGVGSCMISVMSSHVRRYVELAAASGVWTLKG